MPTNNPGTSISNGILRYRWLILCLIVGIGLALGSYIPLLNLDFSPRSLFLSKDSDLDFLKGLREQFSDEDNFLFIILISDELFTTKNLRCIEQLTNRISALSAVRRIVSLTNITGIEGTEGELIIEPLIGEVPEESAALQALKAHATGKRIYRRRFVSPDGRATAIVVQFIHELDDAKSRKPALNSIRRLIDKHTQAFDGKYYLAGIPVVNEEYADMMLSDQVVFLSLAIIMMSIILLVLYRNLQGMLLPMLSVFLANFITLGAMQIMGQKINIINNVIPTLILIIGAADGIHVLSRYYEEIGRGVAKRPALIETIRHMGPACFMTTFTTAIGFASLYVAQITIIKDFGIYAAFGTMMAFVITILFIPTVLVILKPPKVKKLDKQKNDLLSRFLNTNATIVIHHPLGCFISSVVAIGLAIWGITMVENDSRMMEELRPSNKIVIANKVAEKNLTGVLPIEISIKAKETGGLKEPDAVRRIAALQDYLTEIDSLSTSFSYVDLLREMHQAAALNDEVGLPDSRELVAQYLLLYSFEDQETLDEYVNQDFTWARISINAKDAGSKKFNQVYKQIQKKLDELFNDDRFSVKLSGGSYIAHKALNNIVRDMLSSLGIAFLIISVVMTLLFWSVRVGLLAMFPNVVPLLCTMGFMGFAGITLRTATVVIFSLALGIAVDDTIHFLSRFRTELLKTGNYEQAMRNTFMNTGRAVVFTSIMLAGGMSILVFSNFVAIQHFGMLGGLTIVIALLGDLVILPAGLLLFRPRIGKSGSEQNEGL